MKQKVFIVLEYREDKCKVEKVYSNYNSAKRYVKKAERQVRCHVDTTLHIIEKSVEGTEMENIIDLDGKNDIINVVFVHSGDK